MFAGLGFPLRALPLFRFVRAEGSGLTLGLGAEMAQHLQFSLSAVLALGSSERLVLLSRCPLPPLASQKCASK